MRRIFHNSPAKVIKIDENFIWLYTYNIIYKIHSETGEPLQQLQLREQKPYFISNEDYIYGIVKNEKTIYLYNLDLTFITKINYDDNYNKVFFNTNGPSIILRHGRFIGILVL